MHQQAREVGSMALRVRPESKFGGPGDMQVTRHEKGKAMADLIAIGYPNEPPRSRLPTMRAGWPPPLLL
jgi:hypothetical protein